MLQATLGLRLDISNLQMESHSVSGAKAPKLKNRTHRAVPHRHTTLLTHLLDVLLRFLGLKTSHLGQHAWAPMYERL